VLHGDAINRLRAIFCKVCADFAAELVAMERRRQPRSPACELSSKTLDITLLNSLKGVSSRMLRRERPDLRPRYWKGVLWSPSYFAASCGGARIGILKAYIEQQKKPL
jgi:Transposase and inactivated derivatives